MHTSTSLGSLGLTTCPDKLTPAHPTFLPAHPLLSPRRPVLRAVWELELWVGSWGWRQPPKGDSHTTISAPRQGCLGVAERLQQTSAHSRPNHHPIHAELGPRGRPHSASPGPGPQSHRLLTLRLWEKMRLVCSFIHLPFVLCITYMLNSYPRPTLLEMVEIIK